MSWRAAFLVVALFASLASSSCGSSSEEGLYAGAGAKGGVGGGVSTGGAAGTLSTGGGAGTIASGGRPSNDASVEVDAASDAPIDPVPKDAGPDGNDPTACPASMPQGGSPCNVFVNNTDCIYGIKHCVCTVTTWLCVP